MLYRLSVLFLLGIVALPIYAQRDWAALFQRAISHDQEVNASAREQITGQVLPQLCKGKPEFVEPEISSIVDQLNANEGAIRQQASALLSVVASFRPDSAMVLSRALPALIDHILDTVPRIRKNSVATLAALNPALPPDVLDILLTQMNGADEELAQIASFGVARMADSHPTAVAGLIDILVSQKALTSRRIAVIKSLAAAHVINAQLIQLLGNLLLDSDEGIVRNALVGLNQLGIMALAPNSSQLRKVAETATDSGIRTLAQQTLARLESK